MILSHTQKSAQKTVEQLKKLSQQMPTPTKPQDSSLEEAVIDIYLKNFAERLIQTRGATSSGVSYLGRGVEYSKSSYLVLSHVVKDYAIALTGREKSDAVSEITSGLAISKSLLLKYAESLLKKDEVVDYNLEKNKFYNIVTIVCSNKSGTIISEN